MRTTQSLLLAAALACPASLTAASATLLGWNNLGMHCMDSDYSVFSILPPYNTIESQLIVGGRLVTNGNGYTVTYQAVADPSGSFNSTAMGKGNFYTHALALYGAALAPEAGLAGWSMPGLSNTPQAMLFEPTNHPAAGVAAPVNWFRAEGVPISPFDDARRKNAYPLMRMIARNAALQPIASNDVVLPVSDEMDCRVCHASGTQDAAKPAAGWVWNGYPERDYRLNILRLHDEKQFAAYPGLYSSALAARGFNSQGLYRGVVADGKPVLCAACHASEALGAGSYSNIPPLTASVHSKHAAVMDPELHITLDNSANRAACYRCHPGSATRCLRGAMGGAIAADGSMEMQCQSCHGSMTAVGSLARVGWFMEPNCQSCHTGTATRNNGQIRYASSFETTGLPRQAVDSTFATQPNTPAPGLSLYRFSAGHGGLQCAACHGSTHAEFPSTHQNDNVRNQALQGHSGVMIECTACHTAMPNTPNRGPHGMHALGQGWISGGGGVTKHADAISAAGGRAACAVCHGADYRGTVLSRAKADRSFSVSLDGGSFTATFFRGAEVGCYACHNGPSEDSVNTSLPPTANDVTAATLNSHPVDLALGGGGGTVRIISQPAHGSVAWTNRAAVYHPDPGFVGVDTFTFAAYDGSKNSTLATATVTVAQGPVSITALAHVAPAYPAAWPAAFGVFATPVNTVEPAAVEWTFGDGSARDTNAMTSHAYSAPGTYAWSVVARAATASVTNSGAIVIGPPVVLSLARSGGQVTLSWPNTIADTLLEETAALGFSAQWLWVTNPPAAGPSSLAVTLPMAPGEEFFRVRRPW